MIRTSSRATISATMSRKRLAISTFNAFSAFGRLKRMVATPSSISTRTADSSFCSLISLALKDRFALFAEGGDRLAVIIGLAGDRLVGHACIHHAVRQLLERNVHGLFAPADRLDRHLLQEIDVGVELLPHLSLRH